MAKPVLGTANSDDQLVAADGTRFNGLSGTDMLKFEGLFSDYVVNLKGTGNFKAEITGGGRTVESKMVELLQFDDGIYDVQTGVFTSNEPPPILPTISINDVSVVEQQTQIGYTANPLDGGFTSHPTGGFVPVEFIVTLSEPSAVPVTVNYTTSTSFDVDRATTGVPNEDFVVTNGTVTFAPGETSATIRVYVAGDFVPEGDEAFTVTLSDPTNATLADGTGVGTIINDDTGDLPPPPDAVPTVTMNTSTTPTTEGDDIVFTFTRSDASGDLTVNWSYMPDLPLGAATPGIDFTTANNGSVTFADGETTATLSFQTVRDSASEGTEAFAIGFVSSPDYLGILTPENNNIAQIDDWIV